MLLGSGSVLQAQEFLRLLRRRQLRRYVSRVAAKEGAGLDRSRCLYLLCFEVGSAGLVGAKQRDGRLQQRVRPSKEDARSRYPWLCSVACFSRP